MTFASLPPFSARIRSDKTWIDEDFPKTARIGLFHLLNEGIGRQYLSSWAVVAQELRRIARVAPKDYYTRSVENMDQARADAETRLNQLSWERIYDFCERLHGHLAQDVIIYIEGNEVSITRAQSQLYFADEIQRLFDEESLGYEFRDGFVQRRGKRHTISQIAVAQKVLADQKLNSSRMHFSKSLRYFRDRTKPDFENAVKEAVCAIEAAAKDLFPEAKAITLGDFINWATSNGRSLFPKTIGMTLSGLYGFRNSGEGVSHGAASGGIVTAALSEYVLAVSASQIVLLADLYENEDEPPF